MEKSRSTMSINSSEEGSVSKTKEIMIPSQLKFLTNNLKAIINNQLSADNFYLLEITYKKVIFDKWILDHFDVST